MTRKESRSRISFRIRRAISCSLSVSVSSSKNRRQSRIESAVTSRMVRSPDQHVQRLGAEAGALAGRAGHDVHVFFQLFAGRIRFGLAPAPLQIVQNPLELLLVGMAAVAVLLPPELDLLPLGTVQDHVADRLGQLLERGADVERVGLGQRIQDQVEPAGEPLFPRRDGPFTQGELLVGDHQLGVEVHPGAEAGTIRAGAMRVVEREQPRGDLLV